MKPARSFGAVVFLLSFPAFFPAVCHAVTYPPASSFLWGNSAVNQPAQTSFVSGAGLPYRMLLPRNYDSSVKYPVVIFMHGWGEQGTDNSKQLNNNANGAMAFVSTANPDNQALYPCIFVAPQVNGDWKTKGPQFAAILNTLKTYYSVDEDRISLTGLSFGGLGSFSIIKSLPDTFNCLVEFNGGRGDMTIENLPVWIFHAENDASIACGASDGAVKTLRERGIPVMYTRYQSGGHGIWSSSYQLPELTRWVFAQRRGQPMQGVPALQVQTTTLGTQPIKITGTTLLAPGMSATRVGWCRSNNGGGISGTDAQTSGATMTSAMANFTSTNLTGHRIAISKHVSGTVPNTPYLYDVAAVTSATTLTLNRVSSGSNVGTYNLYRPGGNALLNPSPGVTTDNWATWSMDVPLGGSQTIQIIAEMTLSNSSNGGRTTCNYPLSVNYTAPSGDTTPPTLQVNSPSFPLTTTSPTLTINGEASDNTAVTSVTWSTNRGQSGTAFGTSMWAITGLPLAAGPNTIAISARDAKNNTRTVYLQVQYNAPAGTDALPPSITITSPTSADTHTTTASSITLGGTASDNTGLAGVTWTNVTLNSSGPASGAGSWSAGAIPLASGTNVITVTATDLAGNAGTDTITVTRTENPANQAPTVSAGDDQTITLPASATLEGTAADDGLPANTLTTTWSKVSGPGTVIFSNSTSPASTATFSEAGSYILRLTADDGALSAGDDVGVAVSPASSGGPAQRLNFDFGMSGQKTAETGWNNITSGAVGSGTANCVDSTGAGTGIGLSITQAFSGPGDNSNNPVSELFPQSAIRDYIFSETAPGKLRVTGLDTAATYKVTVYGYRNATGSNRVAKYTMGAESRTLNAAGNLTNTAVFNGVAPATDGSLELAVEVAPGSMFAYLSVLVLEKEAPAAPLALGLQSAASRKTHGSAGDFEIDLPLGGPAGIESRSEGANGHNLVFSFDGDLDPAQENLEVAFSDGQLAGTPVVSGSTLSVRVTGVPNASRCTISLSGLKSAAGAIYDGSLTFAVLEGDTNASQFVNVADAAGIRQQSGQPVNAANFRSDINANGSINVGDAAVQRQRSGSSLP